MTHSSEHLQISLDKNGLQKIIFNRPDKKNALDENTFRSVAAAVRASSKDPAVKVIAFSGTGDYFTSGNDLTNFWKLNDESQGKKDLSLDNVLERGRSTVQGLVAALIDCPKILVAVVNGPAIGIGVTMLAHFDVVFASDLATFHCPFTQLAQTPEGCSSLLFPLLTGHTKAVQILILGKKITAQEAFTMNLVTEVVHHINLPQCWEKISDICSLPTNTVLNAKSVMKKRLLPLLHKVNEEECELLTKQWVSDEFLEMITNFMMKKSKL